MADYVCVHLAILNIVHKCGVPRPRSGGSGGSGGIGISKPYDTIVERENQGRRTVFVFYLFLIFILAVLVCAYCFVSVCLFSCLQGLQFVGGSSNNTGAG